MREKPIARGLVFALAAAVLATAITLKHRADQRLLASPEPPAPTDHPLTSELLWCKRPGPDQAVDPGCKTAWRKNQERFFGSDESRANETGVSLLADQALRRAATSPPKGTAEYSSVSGKSSRRIPSRRQTTALRCTDMNTGVIDRFTDVFSRYIDSGFGLLGGEVAFLASTLIVIEVTLAGLFWAFGAEDDVLVRLTKKTSMSASSPS